jgi:hypothetical protein
MNNMKNFLFFATSVGILVFSGDKIYRLWRAPYDQQILQEQASEKRKLLNVFYTSEFKRVSQNYIKRANPFATAEDRIARENAFYTEIIDTERKMVQDGYSNIEVGAIRNKVLNR